MRAAPLIAALLLVACGRTAPGVSGDPAAPPSARSPRAVWLDVDPAAGIPKRDIDDAVALVQAFHSPELALRGVSVVFGNAPLDQAVPIAREVTQRFGPAGLAVYSGAASEKDRGVESEATRALATALVREPLTIVALGPLTNVATVIERHPELISRIARVVAVAGRRHGQRFTTGTTNARGHRDFNFEKDPAAFRALLESGVPVTLAPWELSSTVWITARDLERWSAGSPAARWLAEAAPSWLALWVDTFGVDGFNPFDTLAVAVVTRPDLMTCEDLPIGIAEGPDDVIDPAVQGGADSPVKPYLIVNPSAPSSHRATYCWQASPAFAADLTARLTVGAP